MKESVQRADIDNKIQTINKKSLFFFDAKKESKKHLGGCESLQSPNALMWILFKLLLPFYLNALYLGTPL